MKLINTFATELPWACEPVAPQPLHAPSLLHLNRALLGELGLGAVSEADWLAAHERILGWVPDLKLFREQYGQ